MSLTTRTVNKELFKELIEKRNTAVMLINKADDFEPTPLPELSDYARKLYEMTMREEFGPYTDKVLSLMGVIASEHSGNYEEILKLKKIEVNRVFDIKINLILWSSVIVVSNGELYFMLDGTTGVDMAGQRVSVSSLRSKCTIGTATDIDRFIEDTDNETLLQLVDAYKEMFELNVNIQLQHYWPDDYPDVEEDDLEEGLFDTVDGEKVDSDEFEEDDD